LIAQHGMAQQREGEITELLHQMERERSHICRDRGITRAAFPKCRSSNANSLCRQNSAGFAEIVATFQRDIL
jgi:hypothetical protein